MEETWYCGDTTAGRPTLVIYRVARDAQADDWPAVRWRKKSDGGRGGAEHRAAVHRQVTTLGRLGVSVRERIGG